MKFVILRIVCVLGQGHRYFLRDVTSSSCNDTLSIFAFFCCDFATWNCSPTFVVNFCRKDGQDTTDDLRKRDLREELEDRERRHFSSKDRSYGEIITIPLKPYLFLTSMVTEDGRHHIMLYVLVYGGHECCRNTCKDFYGLYIAIAQILCMYWLSADSSVHGLCKESLFTCSLGSCNMS